MILVNGQPPASDIVSDRGFLYGDGLFETIRVVKGDLRLWADHLERLNSSCLRLKIPIVSSSLLLKEAKQLCGHDSGVLRLSVTRGMGPRGYRQPSQVQPTRVLMFEKKEHQTSQFASSGIFLGNCDTRLGINPVLAGMKHLNRLEQVVARNEWQDEYQEGLMCDSDGNVVEGTMSNLFCVIGSSLKTPELDQCGVEGVLRRQVLKAADDLGILAKVCKLSLEEVRASDAVFMTNSVIGIWPVRYFENQVFESHPVISRLQEYLQGKW